MQKRHICRPILANPKWRPSGESSLVRGVWSHRFLFLLHPRRHFHDGPVRRTELELIRDLIASIDSHGLVGVEGSRSKRQLVHPDHPRPVRWTRPKTAAENASKISHPSVFRVRRTYRRRAKASARPILAEFRAFARSEKVKNCFKKSPLRATYHGRPLTMFSGQRYAVMLTLALGSAAAANAHAQAFYTNAKLIIVHMHDPSFKGSAADYFSDWVYCVKIKYREYSIKLGRV